MGNGSMGINDMHILCELQLGDIFPVCKEFYVGDSDYVVSTHICGRDYRESEMATEKEVVRLRDYWLDTKVSADGLFFIY